MSERNFAIGESVRYAGSVGNTMAKGPAISEVATKVATEGVKAAEAPKTPVQILAESSRGVVQTADESREFLGNLTTSQALKPEAGSGLEQDTAQAISQKEQRIGDLQGELAKARETVSRVREWPQPDFRYQVPYAEIQAESIESAITNEQLEVQLLQKSDGTPGSKDAVIEDFIKSQQRQKATDQGTSLIQSAEARKSTIDADIARYQDLIAQKGQELEEASQQRSQLRTGSDAEPANAQLAQNYDRARFTQRDVNVEIDSLQEGLQKAQERATAGASQIEDQIKKGQAILDDVTQNPEAYDTIPASVEEDPDFESCLKAAKFSESEDTAKFKENIGLDPAVEAKKYFQVRFPEKYAYYERKGLLGEPAGEPSEPAQGQNTTTEPSSVSGTRTQGAPLEVTATDAVGTETSTTTDTEVAAPVSPDAEIPSPDAENSVPQNDEVAINNTENPVPEELTAKANEAFSIGTRDRYNLYRRAIAAGQEPDARLASYDRSLMDSDYVRLLQKDQGPVFILADTLRTALDASHNRILTDEEVVLQMQNEEWVNANSIKAAESLIITRLKSDNISPHEAEIIANSEWGPNVVAALAEQSSSDPEVVKLVKLLGDSRDPQTLAEKLKKKGPKAIWELLMAIAFALIKTGFENSGIDQKR